MSKLITRADTHLAGQLGLPIRDFHRLAFRAGADAIRRRVEETGEIKVPLRLTVDSGPPADAADDKLPVYFPRGFVLMLRELVEGVADLEGGVADYIACFSKALLIDAINLDHPLEGVVGDIRDGYNLTDPEGTTARLVEAVAGWEYIDGDFARKDGSHVISIKEKSPTLPVHLPRGLVELLRIVLDDIADIQGRADGWIGDIIGGFIEDEIRDPDREDGLAEIVCIEHVFESHEERSSVRLRMIEAFRSWQVVDGVFSRKEDEAA